MPFATSVSYLDVRIYWHSWTARTMALACTEILKNVGYFRRNFQIDRTIHDFTTNYLCNFRSHVPLEKRVFFFTAIVLMMLCNVECIMCDNYNMLWNFLSSFRYIFGKNLSFVCHTAVSYSLFLSVTFSLIHRKDWKVLPAKRKICLSHENGNCVFWNAFVCAPL